MGSFRLVDRGGDFFLEVQEGGFVRGSASMGEKELREASKRFDQAARILQSRAPRPEAQRGWLVWFPPMR